MIFFTWVIFPLLFLFVFAEANAASEKDVVINEVAWMGSLPDAGETVKQAANDEWIELYNNTASPVPLAGWILKAADGNPEIALTNVIEPNGYFLLSRANQIVGGIAADLVYEHKNNALENTGEDLKLFDAQGNLIDEVAAGTQWFGGDNSTSTKQTMERKNSNLTGSDPVNWGTSVLAGGTPRSQNSIFSAPNPQPTPKPKSEPEPVPVPQPLPQSEEPLPPPPPPQQIEIAATTTTTTMMTATQSKSSPPALFEIPEAKKSKSIPKNASLKHGTAATEITNATSALPSRQVAAISDVAPQHTNIFAYSLALLLALLSAGTIIILKKRLQK